MNIRRRILHLLIGGAIVIGIGIAIVTQPPHYPQPPIYPGAQNFQEIGGSSGGFRWIEFESTDAPETIYAYYVDTLPAYGWVPSRQGTDRSYQRFGYRELSFAPSIDLYVKIETQRNISHVTLHIILSGPRGSFDEVPDWQWGTPVLRPTDVK